ncbi:MAG: hypothetical protein ED859_16955 [Desulfuromonadales bacterium]|nr:MAG: hypothetical protein ED859_16955 [Desulfuromonadales bacterium]
MGSVPHFPPEIWGVSRISPGISPEVLEKMSAEELAQMHESLHGLEAGLLSVMRERGLGQVTPQGLKGTEKETIRRALEQYRWNITETAKALGIGRNTLYRKIKQFNLLNSWPGAAFEKKAISCREMAFCFFYYIRGLPRVEPGPVPPVSAAAPPGRCCPLPPCFPPECSRHGP